MKRILSVVLAVMLAVTLIVPLTALEADAAFKVRTSMPSFDSAEGKAYYYTNSNVFYANDYGPNKKYLKLRGGYVSGNCTWYAYGRASEILGKPLNTNFRWGANNWWSLNKIGNYYPYGSKPKVGAIACYKNHVAVVEKVVNGKVYVSESGWTISKKCPKTASDLKFHYGTPWLSSLKGYIYITDSISINAKPVDYSVKITAKDLNLRAGPGTSYSRIGYVKQGTYKVTEECGNWAKLETNGYWICLSYAKKVTEEPKPEDTTDQTTESTVPKEETTPPEDVKSENTETSLYKVKVTATSLNMRTGPGTSYKSKGTVKKNSTYEIKAEKNGWGQLKTNGYWIKLSYTKKVTSTSSNSSEATEQAPAVEKALYKVKVTATSLNMRTGPGTSYKSKGTVKKNSTYEIKAEKNGWGQLKSNGYWIKLSYTKKVTAASAEYKVKVKSKDLNMRTGPGTSYKKKGYIKPGTYVISKTSNGWGKLKTNGYWIKLSYTTKI